MIRTKEIQLINPIMRFSGIVYMRALKIKDSDIEGIVEFNNYFSTIQVKEEIALMPRMVEETYCSGYDEETGEKTYSTREVEKRMLAKINRSVLVDFLVRPAIYKQSTFRTRLSNLTPEMYDVVMIAEIDEINKKDWTGNEAQKVFFWDLTTTDMEVVTTETMAELLAIEFIEWVEIPETEAPTE